MPLRLFLAALATLFAAGAAAGERFNFERQLMGTRFTVVCYAEDHSAAEKAASAAFARAETINQVASDYLPNSELSLLTAKPVGTPIPLSSLLYDLLAHSRHVAETTNGAFDPTLGPLTKLWRTTRDQRRLPHSETLRLARASVGWRLFTLDPQTRSLTLHRENMAFDLGGMAKGYAADLMLETLAAAGLSQAMVTAGGDIRLGDAPPGRTGWRVALQTFDPTGADEVVTLANCAVSTSGDLHQSVEIGGVRYSHILDPATGLGLTRRVAVTVIADQGKLSDPLATAACVLDPETAARLRNNAGIREVKIRSLQNSPPPLASPTNLQFPFPAP